ncbi:MAG: hypothetical protein HFG89_08820 [Dorea sp.]|jgi:hypothetical protein|nr:hypothetical protein [Dorea sp.]
MEKRDQLEELLREEFDRIAGEEENVLREENISIPEETQEIIYAGIQEKIRAAEREKEKERLYAQLSEEDMKALEIGRRIMEEEAAGERKVRTVKIRKRLRMCVGLAAALTLTMAIGVTSMGGPERIIQMMTRTVGDREITQIDSREDNLIVEENEEEAYQKIGEEFGVEPVRIWNKTEEMKFIEMEYDEEIQIANLYYEYSDSTLIYLINATYRDTSLGIDIEDKIVDTNSKIIGNEEVKIKAEIRKYEVQGAGQERYSAQFKYKGLEYFFIGTMDKEDFEYVLENLYIYD